MRRKTPEPEAEGAAPCPIPLAFLLRRVTISLERALGKTGTMVIARPLGMLLAALSVQFVLDGLRAAGLT